MDDLSKAMQLQIQSVLMEKELDGVQLQRLEWMLQGAKLFLSSMQPLELMPGSRDGLADVIQRERYKALGFSPEMVEHALQQNRASREAATVGLQRAAAAFGVTDDEDSDEEPEVEEVLVRVDPLRDREIWMPIGLVDKVIFVLADSDGDVAEHLIDVVNDVRARYPNVVHPDSILPIDVGFVTLIAAGLSDPKVRAAHPEVVGLAQQVSQCVMKAAEEKNVDTFSNGPPAQSASVNKEAVNGS